MQGTRSDFVQVIGGKSQFSEYLEYFKDNRTQTNRILFYETFEFLQELLAKELPDFMLSRRESIGFPVARFLKNEKKITMEDAFIPSHLLHHVTRIYDFYFGAEAPVNIDIDQEVIYQIKTDYFSKQVPVNWLDQAVFKVLECLYTDFQGFIHMQKASIETKHMDHKLAKRASSIYSMIFQNDRVSKRSSIYSNIHSDFVSRSSLISSADILDCYVEAEREDSSDLLTTLSPDWESETQDMRIELLNRRPSKVVLSKVTRQLYLDSSGLCMLNSTINCNNLDFISKYGKSIYRSSDSSLLS